MGVVWGGPSDEDNIPGERVVCHPPARARCGTKTWNMNFWPLTLRRIMMMMVMTTMTAEDDDWKGVYVTIMMVVETPTNFQRSEQTSFRAILGMC